MEIFDQIHTKYKGTKIYEDFGANEITIIFQDKSRVKYPFLFKEEKQIDINEVEWKIENDMLIWECAYSVFLPIIFVWILAILYNLNLLTMYSALGTLIPLIFVCVRFDKLLIIKKRKNYSELYFNVIEVRDKEKEQYLIDEAIHTYNNRLPLPKK